MQRIKTHILKQQILSSSFLLIAFFNYILLLPKFAAALSYLVFFLFVIFEKKFKLFFRLLIPLFLVIIVGIINSSGHEKQDIIRDIYYFSNPIIFIILGSFFAINFRFNDLIYIIIKIGTFISILFIFHALAISGLSFWNSYIEIRNSAGVGNSLSVFSLSILLASSKFEFLHFLNEYKFKSIFIIINLIALTIFGSRTYLFIFIGVTIFFYLPFMRKYFIRFTIITILFILVLIITLNSMKGNFFVDKISTSISEIALSDNVDMSDINANYRGFESLKAFDTYLQGGNEELVLGRGFGQLVDLEISMIIDGEDRSVIPIFHNGFVYLLLKTGIIGSFLFLFFFRKISKLAKSVFSSYSSFLTLFSFAVLFSLILSTLVVRGFFNEEFMFSLIILGALIQYMIFESCNNSEFPIKEEVVVENIKNIDTK